MSESSEVTVHLEELAVHNAPDFIHTVAEDESAVFDGDGGRGARKVLAVQVCEHGGVGWGMRRKLTLALAVEGGCGAHLAHQIDVPGLLGLTAFGNVSRVSCLTALIWRSNPFGVVV